jgi:hypothetical protein
MEDIHFKDAVQLYAGKLRQTISSLHTTEFMEEVVSIFEKELVTAVSQTKDLNKFKDLATGDLKLDKVFSPNVIQAEIYQSICAIPK